MNINYFCIKKINFWPDPQCPKMIIKNIVMNIFSFKQAL